MHMDRDYPDTSEHDRPEAVLPFMLGAVSGAVFCGLVVVVARIFQAVSGF